MGAPPPLVHHATVTAAACPAPERWVLFAHGIFGKGANFRTFARRVVEARPSWGAALVDLREHGASRGLPGPHDIDRAAADLLALDTVLPGRIDAIVGHSFGGKVALAYVQARGGDLEAAVMVDAAPGARDTHGSETTLAVLAALEALPASFPQRADFTRALTEAGFAPSIVAWLAMSVEPATDGGFRFALDLPTIRTLLGDYFQKDLWPVLETPPGRVALHLVIGGASSTWSPTAREQARALSAAHPTRIFPHVIEGAGHWVHVDAPDALHEIVVAALA